MSSIPEDLYLPILLRLPVKSTFVCKCVCKSWLSLISDPNFAKLHLDFTPHRRNISSNLMLAGIDMLNHRGGICSINYNSLQPSLWEKNDEFTEMCYPYQNLGYSVEIVGTSNGLICLRLHHIDISDSNEEVYNFFYCLWNPATYEYKKITKPTDNKIDDFDDIQIHAFGYDQKRDDYKLVIGVHSVIEASTAVYVYTLESASWKSVIMVPYCFCSGRSSGVLINGDFHFLARRGEGSRFIVSFDIIEERFKEMEFSIELKVNANWFIIEAVLQGCLSVLLPFRPRSVADDNYSGRVELWVMQDYGVQKSWTKRYVITHEMITRKIFSGLFSLRFILSFKNGEILLLVNDKLILYDPKDASAIERDTGSVRDPSSEAKYLESLVSVNSGTYVGKDRQDSIEPEEA